MMVWSPVKVVPPVPTVTVEVPAASAIMAGFTETVSTGVASSSVMVTVAEPMGGAARSRR